MTTFIIFSTLPQTQGQKVVSSYIQSLFVLTAPGQVLVSRDQDAPLSWVRHMEGLKCQVGLDAGTYAPEWVLRMWATAPQHNLFSWEGSGVPHLCYGCVCNTVGKASVVLFSVSLQSFLSYFLPMFSSLPFSAALQSSRKLILSARVLRQPLFTTLALCWFCKLCEHVVQLAWGCLCAHDTAWLAASGDPTWKPGILQTGDLPGRNQRNLCGTCWQFAWLQPKVLIVTCIHFRKQAFSIFFSVSQYTAVKSFSWLK